MKSSFIKLSFCFLFISCINNIPDENDIYNYIPKGTKLELDLIRKSNSLFSYEKGSVVMINLSILNGSQDYNPHLLFFNEQNSLISACYFSSESFYSFENNEITAYINDYRNQRKKAFRNDVPKNIDINLKDYRSNKLPSSIYLEGGIVNKFDYSSKSMMVSIGYKNSKNLKLENISVPMHKITYDYDKSEIIINDIIKEKDKSKRVLKINDISILDSLLSKVCYSR